MGRHLQAEGSDAASRTARGSIPAPSPQKILSPKGGFMGMVGERGIGGSKCGSTAAVALVYKSKVCAAHGCCSILGPVQVALVPAALG